jgi:hypothetical protein
MGFGHGLVNPIRLGLHVERTEKKFLLVREPRIKGSKVRPGNGCKDNIKMDVRECGWIHLAQSSD